MCSRQLLGPKLCASSWRAAGWAQRKLRRHPHYRQYLFSLSFTQPYTCAPSSARGGLGQATACAFNLYSDIHRCHHRCYQSTLSRSPALPLTLAASGIAPSGANPLSSVPTRAPSHSLSRRRHSVGAEKHRPGPIRIPVTVPSAQGWASGLVDAEGWEEGRTQSRRRSDGRRGRGGEGSGSDGEGSEEEGVVARRRLGRGRNESKRAAKAARDFGLELIDLNRKELDKVASWARLSEETVEAVCLAKALTRKGKNGWRRQVLFVGGLLRGVSTDLLAVAIKAAKEGTEPDQRDFPELQISSGPADASSGGVEVTTSRIGGVGQASPGQVEASFEAAEVSYRSSHLVTDVEFASGAVGISSTVIDTSGRSVGLALGGSSLDSGGSDDEDSTEDDEEEGEERRDGVWDEDGDEGSKEAEKRDHGILPRVSRS